MGKLRFYDRDNKKVYEYEVNKDTLLEALKEIANEEALEEANIEDVLGYINEVMYCELIGSSYTSDAVEVVNMFGTASYKCEVRLKGKLIAKTHCNEYYIK